MNMERGVLGPSGCSVLRVLAFAITVVMGLQSAPVLRAQATNIYLAQSAAGAANGADCADAYSYTFFNGAGNWGTGTGQIGPGTTVHICGTVTGVAGQTLLTFQGSGATGSPITLLFEPGAVLQAPYFATGNGGINVSSRSYIVINGGSNGIVQNTANGAASLGYSYSVSSRAIMLAAVSNVTVKNLTIQNICVASTSDNTECDANGPDTGVWLEGGTNVTITRNVIHDADTGIFYDAHAGDSNNIFSFNTIYHTAVTMQPTWGGGSGGMSGLLIIGNDLYCAISPDTCPWGNAVVHLDLVHYYLGASGQTYSGSQIYNNYFHDLTNGRVTGALNLEAQNGSALNGFYVFNNVFYNIHGYGTSTGVTGAAVYNNTFTGIGAVAAVAYIQSGSLIENNIFQNNGYNGATMSGASGVTSSHNNFYNWSSGWTVAGTGYSTFSGWQTGSASVCSGGCDTIGSIVSNPNLASNYVPNTGSPVIKTGANLAALGIAALNQGAPQYFGVNYACGNGCVARPPSGAWDIGAYPDPPTSGTAPNPPTGLTAVVQ